MSEATTEVSIGGVDLEDMKRAHAQHPVLSRWHQTTLRLLPDLYETSERASERIKHLEQQVSELEAELGDKAKEEL
jgi:hypothetical protein